MQLYYEIIISKLNKQKQIFEIKKIYYQKSTSLNPESGFNEVFIIKYIEERIQGRQNFVKSGVLHSNRSHTIRSLLYLVLEFCKAILEILYRGNET